MEILNMPKSANKYDYVVAREVDGQFWYWGAFHEFKRAREVAEEIDGAIFEK